MMHPKRDSDKKRVILDLSFPDAKSVNAHIPKNSLEGDLFKLQLAKPDALAACIRELGKGTHLYKIELSRLGTAGG